MTRATPIALTIAGSDSSGGAGIQADLKTFSALGVYGASVITALTAQNTRGVHGVHPVPAPFVAAQLDAVLDDLAVSGIKTGMLANAGIILAVVERLKGVRHVTLVVDPVMVATSGDALLEPNAVDAMRQQLLPLATLITPNRPEAARLLGEPEAESEAVAIDQARALLGFGCKAVLLKGGHGTGTASIDVLATRGGIVQFSRPRLATTATHGTGCTLAAAITALLTLGATVEEAVERAKTYVWMALQAGLAQSVGQGNGPLDHLYGIRQHDPLV
jgi:hydroxymethylpyrimidine/phosphomethylpyrimidine kinase